MDMNNNIEQNDTDVFDQNLENDNSVLIPVIHENVMVSKSTVTTGGVRIIKKVHEEDELVNVPLTHEEIDIKTVPINQYVDIIPEPVRYEGDTMIVPVLKEVSIVRVMLVEEIHVTKKRVQTQQSQNVSLRKEEVIIENLASADMQQPS